MSAASALEFDAFTTISAGRYRYQVKDDPLVKLSQGGITPKTLRLELTGKAQGNPTPQTIIFELILEYC